MLNSFQGQALTPIERGLDRASSGFQTLLGSIQGIATRVEQNRKLAEERAYKSATDRLQYERDLDKIRFTKGLESELQLQGIEERAKVDLYKLGQEQKFTVAKEAEKRAFESSEAYLGSQQALSAARASGTSVGGLQERRVSTYNQLEQNLARYAQDYPNINWAQFTPTVGENGVGGFVDSEGRPINMNYILQEASKTKTFLAGLDGLDTSVYAPDAKQQIDNIGLKVRTGQMDYQTGERELSNLSVSYVDQGELNKARSTAMLSGGVIRMVTKNISSMTGQNTTFGQYITEALGGKRMLTEGMLANDEVLRGIMTSDAQNKAQLVEQHLTANYASVSDFNAITSSEDYNKFLEVDPKTKAIKSKEAEDFKNAASAVTVGATGFDNPMITPFQKETTSVVPPNRLANQIIENYSRLTQSYEQILQQIPGQSAAQTINQNL